MRKAVLLSSILTTGGLTTGGCLDEFPAPPSETQGRDAGVISDGSFLDDRGTRDAIVHDAIVRVIDAMPSDTSVPFPQVDAATPVPDAGEVLDAAQLDAIIRAQDAAPVPDAQLTADAAPPMLDAATPDADELDARLVDSAAPDAATADVDVPDAAEPDFGAIIPDATPDAEMPPFIPTTNVPVTNIISPSNGIDCYPNGEGRPSRVREGDILVAAEILRVGESVMVTCLVPDPQNSMTIAHEDAGNCQVTVTDGPLCDIAAPLPNGCVTIRGVITQGDNVTTTPLLPNGQHEIVHRGQQVSPDGHVAMVGVNCPAR